VRQPQAGAIRPVEDPMQVAAGEVVLVWFLTTTTSCIGETRMVNTPRNNEPMHCFVAIELSKSKWVVGFQTPLTDKASRHQVKAGDAKGLIELIERVRTRVDRQLS
jgi:hypothetical protein